MMGEIQTGGWSPRSQRSVENDETARSEQKTVKNMCSINRSCGRSSRYTVKSGAPQLGGVPAVWLSMHSMFVVPSSFWHGTCNITYIST